MAKKATVSIKRAATRKTARLQLRLTPQVDRLIRMAAAAAHKDMTSYVVDAATRASAETLADRRTFFFSDDAWRRFVDALDRPVSPRLREEKPRLARLLSERSALE